MMTHEHVPLSHTLQLIQCIYNFAVRYGISDILSSVVVEYLVSEYKYEYEYSPYEYEYPSTVLIFIKF